MMMTLLTPANLVRALRWLALTAYVVLAGADFGGGVWDALARGPRAREQRRLVAEAMGPVWEANHVWLIAMITGLFTAFPLAFASLSLALYVPLSIAVIGIVRRGAAFAFRAHGAAAVGPTTPWGVLFGVASVVTSALLGAAAAAAASGAIRVSSTGAVSLSPALPWLTPFALDCALLGLALSAQQAAVYLAVEADDAGASALRRHFQRRTLVALGVTAAAAAAGLPLAHAWAPVLAAGLLGRALPLLVLVAVAGGGCAIAVARGHARWGRGLAIVEAAAIVWAWGVAQYPYLIVPDVTVANSAASRTTLIGFVVIAVGGGVLLIPALWLLFAVFKGHNRPGGDRPHGPVVTGLTEGGGACRARRSCWPPSPLARIMPRDDSGTRRINAGKEGDVRMTRAIARRWAAWAVLTLGVCVLAALIVRPTAARGPVAGGSPTAAARAPALRLPALDGRSVSLASFRGHPVALVFLATWCEGCRQELPALVGAARALRPRGLVVLGVDAVAEPPSTVARFARHYDVPFPILLDPSSDAMATFGVRALPTTVVVGSDGTIVAHLESAVDAATLRRVALGRR